MNRRTLLSFSTLLLIGCDSPDNPDPPADETLTIQIPEYRDARPILSYAITQVSNETPIPSPSPDNPDDKPSIGDTCPKCKGKGSLSYDGGSSWTDCTHCGADGKVDDGDPILSSSSPEKPCPLCDTEEEGVPTLAVLQDCRDQLENLRKDVDKLIQLLEELSSPTPIQVEVPPLQAKDVMADLRNAAQELTPADYYATLEGGKFFWNAERKAFVNPINKSYINILNPDKLSDKKFIKITDLGTGESVFAQIHQQERETDGKEKTEDSLQELGTP